MSVVNNSESLQYKNLWLLIGWVLILAIVYFSLTPKPPDLMNGISFGDKIGHFVAYACLMLWFCQLYLAIRQRLLLFFAFVLMGVMLEFLQGLGGIRMFELADMLANSTGVVIGAMLTYVGLDNVLYKIENKMGINKMPD